MKYRYIVFVIAAAVLLGGCRDASGGAQPPDDAAQEMRGVWVSYLDLDALLNGADPSTAESRLDRLLDTCLEQGMNTVFFHVRAHSDAYYRSDVFPAADAAAALLDNGFDPLAYAVKAAHSRALSLHAWINPYRIGEDRSRAVVDRGVFEQNGTWYYDPSDDTARRKVLDGVREILDRYAVDGIHFDDYFYPDGMPTQATSFEEIPSGVTVGDWRRWQVDALISAVYGLTHTRARLFGVSPTALIQTNREKAYADVALWLRQGGYVDYICPQIYFGFSHATNPFASSLAQWQALPRRPDVALYIGLALYKAGLPDNFAASGANEWCEHDDIIARQVQAARQSGADGFVLFRYAHLTDAAQEMTHLKELL